MKEVDWPGRSAIHIAAEEGHRDVVALLLEQGGVDVNAVEIHGQTALDHAAGWGHTDVVIVLLNHPGVDVNGRDNKDWTALHAAAAYYGRTNVLTLLLNHPEINRRATTNEGQTVLHCLLASGWGCDPDDMRILLDNLDVDPNARDLEGATAIMLVLRNNFNIDLLTMCLRVLVESERVDLDLKNPEGLSFEDLAR